MESRKHNGYGLRVLKHLLNWALEGGVIPSNPAAKVTMPRAPAGRLGYLQPTKLQAALAHCPPWIRPVVLLAFSTGMRRGEILGLRFMDVDLLHRQVNLPQTKNGKGRTVYLNEIAKQLGHSDLRMTQRYAHLGASQVRQAVSRLDPILRPLKGPEPETGAVEAKVTRLN